MGSRGCHSKYPDLLEDMSFEDGERYNARLMSICKGETLPDRSIAVEYIASDLWDNMRACDWHLTKQILGPLSTFMKAQTDPQRRQMGGLKDYLHYREPDVGKA